MSKLKHHEMMAIIERGESVSINGTVISRIEDLPLPEKAAETPEDKARILADLEAEEKTRSARIAALKAELAPKPAQSDEDDEDDEDDDEPITPHPPAQMTPPAPTPAPAPAQVTPPAPTTDAKAAGNTKKAETK